MLDYIDNFDKFNILTAVIKLADGDSNDLFKVLMFVTRYKIISLPFSLPPPPLLN